MYINKGQGKNEDTKIMTHHEVVDRKNMTREVTKKG